MDRARRESARSTARRGRGAAARGSGGAEVDRQVDRRRRRGLGQAHERRREQRVAEEGERRARRSVAARPARARRRFPSARRSRRTAAAPMRGCMHEVTREGRRAALDQRCPARASGSGGGDVAASAARRSPAPLHGTEKAASASAIRRAVLLHARRQRAQRAALRARSSSSICTGPGLGRARVVDRQRARRARRVGDGLGQRAQEHRGEVAAVRPAPGAPAGGDVGRRSVPPPRRSVRFRRRTAVSRSNGRSARELVAAPCAALSHARGACR